MSALCGAVLLRPRRFYSRSNLSAVLWRERAALKVRTISRVRVLGVIFIVCFCVVFFAIGRSPDRHAASLATVFWSAGTVRKLLRVTVLAVWAVWVAARYHDGRRLLFLLRVIVVMIYFQLFLVVNAIILLVDLFPLVSVLWAERGALLAIKHHCAAGKLAQHHIGLPCFPRPHYGSERQYSDDRSMTLTG
jgi:hypothetical protein